MAKKLKKDVLGLTKASLITGVGAGAITSIGGAGAVSGAAGMTAMAGFYPSIGSIMGAGAVFRQLRKVKYKKRKR